MGKLTKKEHAESLKTHQRHTAKVPGRTATLCDATTRRAFLSRGFAGADGAEGLESVESLDVLPLLKTVSKHQVVNKRQSISVISVQISAQNLCF